MTNKWTPGPWAFEAGGKRGSWVGRTSSPAEWSALSCGDTDEVANANAQLIAAAPELYEALDAILKSSMYHIPMDEYNRGVRALSRARGE